MIIDIAADRPETTDADAAAGNDSPALPGEKFVFSGTTREFFGIWIVNLLLTVLTVGIYSAWAKVRTRKYFYRHTSFANETFDYHARPAGILFGRLIAAAFFAAYLLVEWFAPDWSFVPLIVLFLVAPWLLMKGAAFNARNSSYRNVRFSFRGTLGESYGAFVGWPLLGILSLGFAMPFALHRQARWRIRNHRFGNAQFAFGGEVGAYYGLYLKALGLLLLGFALAMLVLFGGIALMALLGAEMPDPASGENAPAPLGMILVTGLVYVMVMLLYVFGIAYFVARSMQIGLGRSTLAGRPFTVAVRARDVAWLYLTNMFVILLTLGLAVPWAKIRTARYQLSRISLDVDEAAIRQVVSSRSGDASALGEEMGDAFDVEFDFGI
jgi:uncharacterized membrane protein YjgN (DUF898 family)